MKGGPCISGRLCPLSFLTQFARFAVDQRFLLVVLRVHCHKYCKTSTNDSPMTNDDPLKVLSLAAEGHVIIVFQHVWQLFTNELQCLIKRVLMRTVTGTCSLGTTFTDFFCPSIRILHLTARARMDQLRQGDQLVGIHNRLIGVANGQLPRHQRHTNDLAAVWL